MSAPFDTKILISLDEGVAELIAQLLKDDGHGNVEQRPADAAAFLEAYRPGECGLIISQRSRTNSAMDGLALLSEVRKRDQLARFLVLSGSPEKTLEETVRRDGLDLGGYTYLSIPFDRKRLLEAVHRALA